MNRFLAGIFLLLLAPTVKVAIPFFPCDSVYVFSINVNYAMQRMEFIMQNTSQSSFNTPELSGSLNSNPYITIGSQPGQNAVLDIWGGPNGGQTGFAILSTIADPATIPAGTLFTGMVTLYNPNDLSASCDYNISFTYGTGPIGIATFMTGVMLPAFPNPAGDIILLGEDTPNVTHTYFIYDCSGRLVLTSRTNRVDVSGLSAGTYIFRREERTGKFVKL